MRTREELAAAAKSGTGVFRMTRHEILEEFDHDAVFSSYDFLYLAVHGKLTFHGRTVEIADDIDAE
jgi:hypothetical protein